MKTHQIFPRLDPKAILLAIPLALATPMAAADHGHGHAHEQGHGHATQDAASQLPAAVRAEGCWIRPLPQNLPAAAYMRLVNTGTQAETVTGVHAPGFGHVMLHKTETRDGMTSMAHLASLEVPAGQAVALEPGSYHVMLEKPARALATGETVPITLAIEGAAPLTVDCEVKTSSSLK